MRSLLFSIFSVAALSFLVATAQAEPVAIPDKAKASILKRHPQAQDLQVSQETHFGNPLLSISFKSANDEIVQELFRPNGVLFTNKLPLENPLELPATVSAALDAQFSNHHIQKAELVVNPNGVGEEYVIYIEGAGGNWLVISTDKGEITSKQRF
jgi:hypothetical protein